MKQSIILGNIITVDEKSPFAMYSSIMERTIMATQPAIASPSNNLSLFVNNPGLISNNPGLF